jgi:hypothetical protein
VKAVPAGLWSSLKQAARRQRRIEEAKKAGYVQGVCECAAVLGKSGMAGKLLAEMKVTKALAKKFASPDTYQALEQSVFAPKRNRKQVEAKA